jgi:multimeric flavodoxin WrbA
MKIIGICGSPRKGNTEILLKGALKAAKEKGAETELILLREKKIELCDGCQICETTGKCHILDDMQEIYSILLKADGIIFGSPVFWNNVTPHMKNFIDRMNPIGYKIAGKPIGIILVGSLKGREKGESHNIVIKWFKGLNELYKTKLVGVVDVSATLAGEIQKNKKALAKARKLGEKFLKI